MGVRVPHRVSSDPRLRQQSPAAGDYIAWRAAQLRALPRADRKLQGLPTYDVIKDRFGGWQAKQGID